MPIVTNWMFGLPTNSDAETLWPIVIALECGISGRFLGFDELRRREHSWMGFCPCKSHGRAGLPTWLCEDTKTRQHSAPWKQASPEPSHAGPQSSDFQPPELWEWISVVYKPPRIWYFITAAQTKIPILWSSAQDTYLRLTSWISLAWVTGHRLTLGQAE